MAYLHCHSCDWGQDDFWEPEGYNPFVSHIIDTYKDILFRDTAIWIDEENHGRQIEIDARELVARELERKAQSIRNMRVKTYEDWKKIKDTWTCPECGSGNWDID